MEKVRALSYDQITEANLDSSTFAGGQFGTSWKAFQSGGSSRDFTIQYTVSPVPAGAPAGSEKFKQVTVDVYWTGPPLPVKHVVLETLVYRQYAGPGIVNFSISPLIPNPNDATQLEWINSDQVTFSAAVNETDVASTQKVRFSVYGSNGKQVASQDVTTGSNGVYTWTWDSTATPNATYTFEATAFSTTGYQGNTATQTYVLERGGPPALTNLTASAGDNVVSVQWDPSPVGNLDHYEVWRSTTSGGETLLAGASPLLTSATYVDTAVTDGSTYYYEVYAVDSFGLRSPASAEVSAVPAPTTDTTTPTVPTGLAATIPNSPTVTLNWTASIDDTPAPVPPLTTDVEGYDIWRSVNGGPYSELQSTGSINTLYNDTTANWATTYSYEVRAYDWALNYSAFCAPVSISTGPAPTGSLKVTNGNTSTGAILTLMNDATGIFYNTSGAVVGGYPSYSASVKKNKAITFAGIPIGTYDVEASWNSGSTWKQFAKNVVTAGKTTSLTVQ